MWVAKFRNWHESCLIGPLCIKFKITDYVYLLNHWEEKNNFYYTELHLLEGEKEEINKFIKEFKKDKSLKKIEVNKNQIITLNILTKKDHSIYASVFDKRIIYTKPVIQHTDGFETWELASWDKDTLMKILDIPDFEMEILSLKKVEGVELFLPQIQPNVSDKQMASMKLAIKEGYYNFPRKTDLNKLAVKTEVSKQTFQENLRRAENKLVPFLVEGLK